MISFRCLVASLFVLVASLADAAQTVLQPGPADGKDIWTTSVYSYAPGGSFPGGGLNDDRLRVGGWADEYHSLLQFDLSSAPASATSATLELFVGVENAATAMQLDRITEFWDWKTQGTGRDHDRLWWADKPSAEFVRSLPAPVVGQWYSIDVTDLYNGWKSGQYPNYGLQLRPVDTNNTWNEFYSSDYLGSPELRPRLVIESSATGACGDSNGDSSVTAADALQALRTAVDLALCVLPRCDYNNDREVKASDALAILRRAVGIPSNPACPAYPETLVQLDLALEQVSDVSNQARALVDAAIAEAHQNQGTVDVDALVDAIAALDGVEFAELSDDASTIVVKSESGVYSNILLVNMADSRLFVLDPAEQQSEPSSVIAELEGFFLHARERVEGNKALILAPFDFQDFGDADAVEGLLEAAGFVVTVFKDEAATLDKFRGDYLQQFDVLYVATHGGYGTRSTGERTTVLATGQPSSDRTIYDDLDGDQKASLSSSSVSGADKNYWIISVPWLRLTGATNFRHGLFFTVACKSAKDTQGPDSLVDQMLSLNLGAFVGFDRDMFITLGSAMAKKAMTLLSNGATLEDACDSTRNSPSIQYLNYTLILRSDLSSETHFGPASFRCFQRLAEPFFMADEDDAIGVATLTPSSGPTGTAVVFSVTFKDSIANSVSEVTIDIDNTGEHLQAAKQNENTWTFTDLTAPFSPVYPRVDTFTFTAFDSDQNELGQGAATFTILQSPAEVTVGARASRRSYSR